MSKTTDAIAAADAATIEARNQRGWTPAQAAEIRLPVGKNPAFAETWQALMQRLELILSLAHQRVPSPTEYKESVSIAKHLLDKLIRLAE